MDRPSLLPCYVCTISGQLFAARWLSLMIARRADWKRAEQSAALSSRDFCGPVRRGKRRSA